MATFGEEGCVNLSDDVNDLVNNEEENQHEKDSKSDSEGECYKKINELTADDIRGLEFSTEEEGCLFYHKYAQYRGFASRKDDVYKDNDGNIVTRQLVCNKAGRRHEKHFKNNDRVKQPKAITRVGCLARFRIRHDHQTLKWKVAFFEENHNHDLAPAEHVHLIPSYRGLTDGDKAQVDSLKLYGVRTCNIMGVMLGQKGGHESVGFTKRDLSNHIDKERRQRVQNGDSVAALSYLQAKADNDPLYYFNYSKTDDGNLKDLFWCDGVSRLDYNAFGDVIAFDSTYRKNKYNKPLVIFCGYNHHKETTIFAAALVSNESSETYVWVLNSLSEAMFNKHPKVVVTDGDPAMRQAIKVAFPNTTHRLCAWHINRNVAQHVHDPDGLEEFNLFIYASMTPERFEEKWKIYIEKYGLIDDGWTQMMYKMKSYWASTFMKDKFFAGVRTTSMCEGINSFIKKFLQCKSNLFDFLLNFERAVKEYRHNELNSDFNSTYTEPVITTALCGIEHGAAKILTRKVFMDFKSQIQDALGIKVIQRSEVSDIVMLRMQKFCKSKKEYLVVYDKTQKRFVCDCGFFEYCGIPCCHIVNAMKHEDVNEFPTSLICKRWLKSAKADHVYSVPAVDLDSKKLATLRRGAMSAACNILTQLCCDNEDDFVTYTEEIYKLVSEIQKRRNPNSAQNSTVFDVGDPTVVKTRGYSQKKKNVKKKRHCSNCKQAGHTIRKCPRLFDKNLAHDIDGGESSIEGDEDTRDDEVNGDGSLHAKSGNAYPRTESHKRKSEGVHSSVRCSKKLKDPLVSPATLDSVNALSAKRKVEVDVNQHAPVGPQNWFEERAMNFGSGIPVFPQFPPMKFIGMLNEVEEIAKAKGNLGA